MSYPYLPPCRHMNDINIRYREKGDASAFVVPSPPEVRRAALPALRSVPSPREFYLIPPRPDVDA
jgi:hypothetical protein